MINADRPFDPVHRQSFIGKTTNERKAEGFFSTSADGAEPDHLYFELFEEAATSDRKIAIQLTHLEELQGRATKKGSNITIYETNKTVFVTCLLIDQGRPMGKFSVGASFRIDSSMRAGEKINPKSTITLDFKSRSFSFYLSLHPVSTEYDDFIMFQAIASGLFLFSIFCLRPKRQEELYSISEWMILQTALFSFLTSCFILGSVLSRLDTKLWMVAVCSLANIVFSFLFIRNYEGGVVRSFEPARGTRFCWGRAKQVLGALFVVGYFVLCTWKWRSIRFWIGETFVLLGMLIQYSYKVGGKGGMSFGLLLTLIFSRLSFFYFMLATPDLTGLIVDRELITVFLGECGCLLAIMLLQRVFGARFILPKELITDYFAYHQRIDKHDQLLEEECSICTQKLKEDVEEEEEKDEDDELEEEEEGRGKKKGKGKKKVEMSELKIDSERLELTRPVMRTPCKHYFHPSCLEDWMRVRLNCPYCR